MTNAAREELAELRARIRMEAHYIGKKPYSHNLVGMLLREVAEKFGIAEANKAVRNFHLKAKGFNEESEDAGIN